MRKLPSLPLVPIWTPSTVMAREGDALPSTRSRSPLSSARLTLTVACAGPTPARSRTSVAARATASRYQVLRMAASSCGHIPYDGRRGSGVHPTRHADRGRVLDTALRTLATSTRLWYYDPAPGRRRAG